MANQGFRRACSHQITVQTPKPPDTYSDMLAVIAQDEENLFIKDLSQLETTDTCVIINMNQQDTKKFKAGIPAYFQLRCYASEYDAPGTAEFQLEVWPVLDARILGSP